MRQNKFKKIQCENLNLSDIIYFLKILTIRWDVLFEMLYFTLMKGPFIYYTIALQKQIGIYISLIIFPVLMPYILNGVMNCVTTSPSQLKNRAFSLPLLPQPENIAYYDDNTVYFSYSPDNSDAKNMIDILLQVNNLTSVKTMSFPTASDAEKYITIKSLVPNATSHFQNSSFYSKIICEDLFLIYGYNSHNCNVDLSNSYKSTLSKQYNIEEDVFDKDISNDTEYKNNIFFHINFNISEEQIGGVPMHIQYEVIHNQTMLDETMHQYPDPLGKKYAYFKEWPYWTGYSFVLQEQLDNITINRYTDLNIQKTYSNPDQLVIVDIQAQIFYEMTCLLGFSLIYIFQIIILVQQRGQNYILLKRLGINTLHNLFIQYLFIFIPSLISGIICAISWHYTGILPYDNVTLDFAVFANFLIIILISSSTLFFVALSGANQVLSIVLGCIIAFFIFLVGGMFHAGVFMGNSIFDPSLAPQPVIWILMFFLPPLGVLGLMDMMTTTIPHILLSVMRDQYTTKVESQLYPLSYVFDKNNPAYKTLKTCKTQSSPYGIQKYGICQYYLPPMYYVVILTLMQSVMVLPLLSLWFSYIIPQKGFRKLSMFFFLRKEFWRKLKHLKPGKLVIDLENITIAYRVHSKQKKKYILGKNIALKQISYIQNPNTISGVIGECSSGKSTLMGYLSGELNNFNIMKMYSSGSEELNQPQELNKLDYEQHSHSKKSLIQYLHSVYAKPKATVLENYDLTNPIDAHFIKPYIGYLAQDFSNVWMSLNCYQNVYLSLLLRKSAQHQKVDLKQCKIETMNLLTKVGLQEIAVLKRKAIQLSGGMLRRLALANAIAGKPKIILLDELSSGVDPVVKYKIIQCIKEIVATKESNIIVSTHDTSEIQQLIQYLTILDDGFLMVKNITPFDLQQRFNIFTIKFYSKESTCSEIIGNKIKAAIQEQNLVDNPEHIKLDQVSPHSIEIQISNKLNEENIIKLNTLCDNLVKEYNFDDYILSKARLDSAYMQMTDYAQKEQENIKKKAKVNTLQTKVSKNRVYQLIKLFIVAEYKNKFPIALVFAAAVIFIGFLFKVQYSLMVQQINTTQKAALRSRHLKAAQNCLDSCLSQYSDLYRPYQKVTKCFTDRLNSAQFDGRESLNIDGKYQQCAYYFNYLGLDQQYPYYANIGDNQVNNFYDGVSVFTIKNPTQQTIQSRPPLQQRKFNKYDSNTPKLVHGMLSQYYTNFTELYQNQEPQKEQIFDPSINKTGLNQQDTIGISPYILPYSIIYDDDGCTINKQGYYFCTNLYVTHENQCGDDDNFNYSQCIDQFASNKCDDETVVLKQIDAFNVIDSDYIDLYRQSLQLKQIYSDQDISNNTELFNNINAYGKIISPANLEFTGWNVTYQQNPSQQYPRLYGTISIKQTNLLPNTGNDIVNFYLNQLTFIFQSNQNYICNDKYMAIQMYKQLTYPRVSKFQQNDKMGVYAPTRPHVMLFNKVNEPMVKITSALLRKQMFNSVNEGNYTPWNSTYSMISRAMPKIADTDLQIPLDINNSILPQAIMIALLPVSIIFVAIYISIRQALENENNTIRLLRYHFISPIMWYIANYCTNLIIGLMITLFMLIIILIIQPNILVKSPYTVLNIPFYILSGIYCVSYGMLSSLLIKKVRYTLVVNFIIGIFIAFFNLFLLSNDTAIYLIGFFLPNYVMQYYYYRIMNEMEIGVGMIFYGLLITVLQIIGGYIVFNLDDIMHGIKMYWKHERKTQKIQNTTHKNIEEASLLCHHTSYDLPDDENKIILLDIMNTAYTYYNGTKALKNINIQVDRGLIFGLLGSNGSGKSTLMSLLAGVLKYQQGKAVMHIEGKPNVNLYKIPQTSKYFSVVPQHDLYWGNLTVYDHLKHIAQINCLPTSIDMDSILQSLELTDYAGQKVSNLSGGMKRKISIGMALTLQSPIIAFDEPSCGLGVTTKRQLHESIRKILNRDTTVIIISHDMEEIEQLTDKCCIMSKGELIASGSISQLRKQSPYGLCLHIRTTKANADTLGKALFAVETEYNKCADLWNIQYGQQITETQVLGQLQQLKLLESQWNIEKQLMEHIFIDLVKSRELQ